MPRGRPAKAAKTEAKSTLRVEVSPPPSDEFSDDLAGPADQPKTRKRKVAAQPAQNERVGAPEPGPEPKTKPKPKAKPKGKADMAKDLGLISGPGPETPPPPSRRGAVVSTPDNRRATAAAPAPASLPDVLTPENRRADVATTPLAFRSRGPPPALRRPCCLRCSKRIVTNPGYHCDVKPNVRCSYCSKGHKPCDSIPVDFFPRVNRLLDAADALEDDEVAGPALIKRQKSYTAAVTAHQRVAGREGLKKKPTTEVEVGLLQLAESRRQTRLFEGMLDSYRAVHNLPPLVHDPLEPVAESSEDEEDEDDEADDGTSH